MSSSVPDNCCKCGEGISNERPGCTALDQMFHVACFTCNECGKQLAGASFYNVDGRPLCEQDYKNSLERCVSCGEPIMTKLLRASGSTYHPACFVCSVCKKCLDGVPFTVDSANNIHCVACFHHCYPLDQHLYCKSCNGKRLIALSRAA
uniref:Lipoma-preferred partner n=1 Tax=Ascaris suum TaxID=6253 RepID=F1L825_ASCSU